MFPRGVTKFELPCCVFQNKIISLSRDENKFFAIISTRQEENIEGR
jgi:hypothetical protein